MSLLASIQHQTVDISAYIDRLDEVCNVLDRLYAILKPVLPYFLPFLLIARTALFIWRNVIPIASSMGIFAITGMLIGFLIIYHPTWLPGTLESQIGIVLGMSILLVTAVYLVSKRYNGVEGYKVSGLSQSEAHEKLVAQGFIALPAEANLFIQKIQAVIVHPLTIYFLRDAMQGSVFGLLLDCPSKASQYYLFFPCIKQYQTFKEDFAGKHWHKMLPRLHTLWGRVASLEQVKAPRKRSVLGAFWCLEACLVQILPSSEKFAFAAVTDNQVYMRGPVIWMEGIHFTLQEGKITIIK
jgi:hypothetical protein